MDGIRSVTTSERTISFNILARILGRRSEQTRNIENLDHAIGVLTDTVPLIQEKKRDANGSSYLETLLGTHSEQQGNVGDLNAGILSKDSVLQLMSNNDYDRRPM